METIETRYRAILEKITATALACGRDPGTIQLVGVSKKQTAETVRKGVQAGVKILGENYIQEAVAKIENLGDIPAAWHFIGHLQSNKARIAVRHFDLIHTVDSVKLAGEIDRQARNINKIQKILLQINISEESTKSGADRDEALVLAREIARFPNVAVKGLMGMPPFFDDPENARPFFKALAGLRHDIAAETIPGISMEHLSMGMSGDFTAAIEEGATLVRIGTALFGERA